MVKLELPHVNVLTKVDLLEDKVRGCRVENHGEQDTSRWGRETAGTGTGTLTGTGRGRGRGRGQGALWAKFGILIFL